MELHLECKDVALISPTHSQWGAGSPGVARARTRFPILSGCGHDWRVMDMVQDMLCGKWGGGDFPRAKYPAPPQEIQVSSTLAPEATSWKSARVASKG